jgi:hypothetical protein
MKYMQRADVAMGSVHVCDLQHSHIRQLRHVCVWGGGVLLLMFIHAGVGVLQVHRDAGCGGAAERRAAAASGGRLAAPQHHHARASDTGGQGALGCVIT